jgi:hypothetical protein
MLSTDWFSGKVRFPCYLRIGFQAKRGLHDACNLVLGQSAVFMTPVTWFSGKRGPHNACGLVLGQVRSPCYLRYWVSGRRGLHNAYNLDFG